MKRLLSVSSAIDWLNDKIGLIVCWLGVLMILVGAFNALARYLAPYIGVSLSSNAYLEAQWYLFGIMFMLGAGYTLRKNEHVRVDVLFSALSSRAKALIDLIGSCFILVPFCAIVIWLSLDWVMYSWQSWEMSSNPGGLPRYPIKTIVPIAFVLLLIQGVSQAIKSAAVLTGDLDSHTPGEGEPESPRP